MIATAVGAAVLVGWRAILGHGTFIGLAGLAVAGAVYVGILLWFGLDDEERFVWERIKTRTLKRVGR
jgi:hypothetical protein